MKQDGFIRKEWRNGNPEVWVRYTKNEHKLILKQNMEELRLLDHWKKQPQPISRAFSGDRGEVRLRKSIVEKTKEALR